MKPTILFISAVMLLLLNGCALLKVVTVPVKATTTVVGGAADVID